MRLTKGEIRALQEVLEALAEGQPRRFEDHLWLGFGDSWHPLRGRLVASRYIIAESCGEGEASLTERGERLLGELRRRVGG